MTQTVTSETTGTATAAPRMIFVNLVVEDVQAARRFWSALGFGFNETFSTDDTACLVISDTIYAMLMTAERMAEFVVGEVGDPRHGGTTTLLALSCSSRQEVDDLLAKAFAAGAGEWKPRSDLGYMVGGSFVDPAGHVWELVWMDIDAAAAAAAGQQS